MNCAYCRGARCMCTCTKDCGARTEEFGNSHVCGQAPKAVIKEWLRSTGNYNDEELNELYGEDEPSDDG
jgi:hypothetical protein